MVVQLLEQVSCKIFSCGPADSQSKPRLQELKVRMLIRPSTWTISGFSRGKRKGAHHDYLQMPVPGQPQ